MNAVSQTPTIDELRARGRWNPLWDRLAEWEPQWLECFAQLATSPWRNGVLSAKTIEFVCIAGDAACSHLYAPGAQRHIAAALDAGASREEILGVLKLASLLGLQTFHFAVPILAEATGASADAAPLAQLREWDAAWTEQVARLNASARDGVLDAKTVELICVGVNAAATHMNEAAVRHHVKAALHAGASRAEIVEVLKVATTVGIHACNLAVPILDQELAARLCTP
jgi:alkylhydroperoxidase/carboxymuconolactone decarboxylase family protein YurZ